MSEEWITYITGKDLIARVTKERAEFAKLWDDLTDEQMTQRPGPQSNWSVKDLIAHLTWWEQHMVKCVTLATSGGTVVYDETIDEANERVFEEKKDIPLDLVLVEWKASFPTVIKLVESLSDSQINDSSVANIEDKALLNPLIGDTFGHYKMHRNDLEIYVKSLK